MSARSIQAARLGCVLAQALGLSRVEICWSGQKKRGSFGGWRVEWTDGPTVPTMRTLVRQHAERFPAVPVADLGYDRCHSPLAEAIALLLYVDRDRAWANDIVTPLVISGFDAVDWPERAEPVWHDRAHALLRYTPQVGAPIVTADAVHALAEQARSGWANALAWLDRLATGHAVVTDAPNVIDLAGRRAARMVGTSRPDYVREREELVSELRKELAGLRGAVDEVREMVSAYRRQQALPARSAGAQPTPDA